MPTLADPAFDRRLALVRGEEPVRAHSTLRALAAEAQEAPSFELMHDLCRALSDRNRLRIAAILKRQAPLAGCEIQAALGLSQATISHHMRALVATGIVEAERTGKWVYYRLEPRYERLVP